MSTIRGEVKGGVLHLEGLPYPDGEIEVRLTPAREIPDWIRAITLEEDDPTFVAPPRTESWSRPVHLDAE